MNWPGPTRLTLLVFLSAIFAFAQSASEGLVEGIVTDATGAGIVGVTLQARNVNTSAKYATTTDERGCFRFLILPVGAYEIIAEHPGFASLIQKDVVVTVGARINLSLTLSIASQTQRLVVSGETPLVETTRSQLNSTVDDRMIGKLPVNGAISTTLSCWCPAPFKVRVSAQFLEARMHRV